MSSLSRRIEQGLRDCFEEIYMNANPPAMWDELLRDSPREIVYGKEKIMIPFEDYTIDNELLLQIVEKYTKKLKLSKYMSSQFKIAVYLGPSPTSINIKTKDEVINEKI